MKRKTKAQREAAQIAALQQRLIDIYSGAQGNLWSEDDFATAEVLSRVLPVVEKELGPQQEHQHSFGIWNLDHFDNPEKAAEFLFGNGYRA
jgi:hypothetical protein